MGKPGSWGKAVPTWKQTPGKEFGFQTNPGLTPTKQSRLLPPDLFLSNYKLPVLSWWEYFPRIFFQSLWKWLLLSVADTNFKTHEFGTSLVVQWLRICLAMQGMGVWALVEELRSHMPVQQLSPGTATPEACTLQSPSAATRESRHYDERSFMTQQRAHALQLTPT